MNCCYASTMDYHFFYGNTDYMSNFYLLPRSIASEVGDFVTSEQYFMYEKALYFGDHEIAAQLCRRMSPAAAKKLGRAVKNFDEARWNAYRCTAMLKALRRKFHTNPELAQALVSTYPKVLVEASPRDRIWGIGMGRERAMKTPSHEWPGLNLLGKALMTVRDELRGG